MSKTQHTAVMKKGTRVSMSLEIDGFIDGITIEDQCETIRNGIAVSVIRVKWEDGSQSIEDVSNLF